MHPTLLRIGPLTIYSYGTMVALGFSLAIFLLYRRASEFNLDKNRILDLSILALISGLIGARLFYIVLNLTYYIANPFQMFNISEGGLVWYGAFLAGIIVGGWYLRKNEIQFWPVADFIAPYIALAQSVGRLGCFLNGCCFGVAGHPTQLYSSLASLLIFVILRLWQDRRRFDGEIFLGYCILYSSKRFLLEFLRGDSIKVLSNLTLFQLVSILIFFISLIIFLHKVLKWRRVLSRSK